MKSGYSNQQAKEKADQEKNVWFILNNVWRSFNKWK
jgi:hypothetical protein